MSDLLSRRVPKTNAVLLMAVEARSLSWPQSEHKEPLLLYARLWSCAACRSPAPTRQLYNYSITGLLSVRHVAAGGNHYGHSCRAVMPL